MKVVVQTVKWKGIKMESFDVGSDANGVDAGPRFVRDSKVSIALGAGGRESWFGNRIIRVVNKQAFGGVFRGSEGP